MTSSSPPRRRRVLYAALFAAALMAAACGDESGQVAVSFSWETAPPTNETFWISVEVQQRPRAQSSGVVLASVPQQRFVVGDPLRLSLPAVPNGDDRRVVIELRRSSAERVSYYGVSEAFSMVAGESTRAAVAVALRAPLAETGNTIQLGYPAGVLAPSADDLCDVTVTTESTHAAVVEIANNASFEDVIQIDVQGSDDCEKLEDGRHRCVTEDFVMRPSCPDGAPESSVYAVFARFVDEYGYASAALPAPALIDNIPPVAVFSAVGPTMARPGTTVALSVTANEATAAAELSVFGDPTADPVPSTEGLLIYDASQLDETTWRWSVDVAPDVAGGSVYGFDVALTDPAGNAGEAEVLQTPSGAGPLKLVIDAEAPRLTLLSLHVNGESQVDLSNGAIGGGSSRIGNDDVIHLKGGDRVATRVRLTDDIALAHRLSASIGPLDLACTPEAGGERTREWLCEIELPVVGPDAEYEGRTIAALSEVDRAGNQVISPTVHVQIDNTPPQISGLVDIRRDDNYAPAVAQAPDEVFYRPGSQLTIRFAVNEPLPVPPTLTIAGVPFTPESFTEDDLVVDFAVSGALPEGAHDMILTMSDRAQNVGTTPIGQLHADGTAPVALSPEQLAHVLMYRAPYGTHEAPSPTFEVRVCPGPWDFCEGVVSGPFEEGAMVLVHQTGGPSGCAFAPAAMAPAAADGGALVAQSVDLPLVCVSSMDRAGNRGQAVAVSLGEWVGRAHEQAFKPEGGVTFGSWPYFSPALTPPGEVEADVGDALGDIDGVTIVTEGMGEWRRTSSPLTSLEVARHSAVLVTDTASGELLLGPGCVSDGPQSDCGEANETEADGSSVFVRWTGETFLTTPIGGAASTPGGRSAAAATYAAPTGAVLLFGGHRSGPDQGQGVALDDLWSYRGDRWTPLSAQDGEPWPQGRYFSAMSFDLARNEAVLFGGCPSSADPAGIACSNAGESLEDLWLYTDGVWRRRLPEGAESWPPGRWGHALVYDAARQETVLYGGAPARAGEVCADEDACITTWLWDGAQWRAHRPEDQVGAYPRSRFSPAMAYDPVRAVTVMWGCSDGPCEAADTWEWDGQTWKRVAAPGVGPPPLQGASMAFEPSSGETILVGGREACWDQCPGAAAEVLSAAVWRWNGQRWQQAFNGVSDVAADQLTDHVGGPSARSFAAIAVDHAAAELVVTGGSVLTSVEPYILEQAPFDMIYRFDGAGWRAEAVSGPVPPSVVGPTTVSHPTSGVLMFAGSLDLQATNALWHLDGDVWTERGLGDNRPPTRFGVAASIHEGELLIFGGAAAIGVGSSCPPGSSGEFGFCVRGDTWLWNPGTDAWRELTGSTSPEARQIPAMAYDSGRGVSVLFGGVRAAATPADCTNGQHDFLQCLPTDVWEFDGSRWRDVTPAELGPDGSPDGRRDHDLFYHPGRGTVVLAGGSTAMGCDGGPGPRCETVWEWDGSTWSRLEFADLGADGQPEWQDGRVVTHFIADSPVTLATREVGSDAGASIGVFRLDDKRGSAPAHALHLSRRALLDGRDAFEVTDASVSWTGGGVGEDAAGTTTHGAALWAWNGHAWTQVASNGAGVDAPELIHWASQADDPLLAYIGALPPEDSAHFVVTPTGTNGRGTAAVVTDHVEVRLRYRVVGVSSQD